ncbi:hypothetical protein RhiJN_13737 [Ceratobasidium sp. AG-Ba]|nr:hypothetical protein RhiJN_13737 [Ceratobasidium sp. AG-Ba]QRW14295.1 hypothetical protein RhiLY_13294 [Ceratobasidium sp. AG-Ba]
MLPVLILLGAILLALPGLAPYVHGFVSVVEYPAYAYFTWRYAPLVIPRLAVFDGSAFRMARSWVEGPCQLVAQSHQAWVFGTIERAASPQPVRHTPLEHVETCSQVPVYINLSAQLHRRASDCDIHVALRAQNVLARRTGCLHAFICVLRADLVFGAFPLVVEARTLDIARPNSRAYVCQELLLSARLEKWTILTFILHEDILVRELCNFGLLFRSAFRQCAFRLVRSLVTRVYIVAIRFSRWVVVTRPYLLLRRLVRLLLKRVIVPTVWFIVFKTNCWAFMACELFAALLVPLYYADLLFHRWYKSREEVSRVPQPLALSIQQEKFLSSPQSPSRPSPPAISKGVRRLGHFINAYLDECASAKQVIQLEGQLENTPSIHAPRPFQATPSTPSYSLPVAPVPRSPALSPVSPVETTTASDPSPRITFEPADEDEEMVGLADRLSCFHIDFEAGSVPRRSRRVSQRSTITFGTYGRSPDTPLMTSPRERWTDKRFEAGWVAYMQMRK